MEESIVDNPALVGLSYWPYILGRQVRMQEDFFEGEWGAF